MKNSSLAITDQILVRFMRTTEVDKFSRHTAYNLFSTGL